MNPSLFFDNLLTLFMFSVALLILTAVAKIVDSFMDPPCRCNEIRRQNNETGGVEL